MEALFGEDFSDVRVHVGPEATALGAQAFATGRELYFAPGRYRPWSRSGRRLLAHELTHVVQQRAGRVRASAGTPQVVEDAALEAEADRMGALAARWRPGRTRPARALPPERHGSPHEGSFPLAHPGSVIQCKWEVGTFRVDSEDFTHKCSTFKAKLGTLYWRADLDRTVYVEETESLEGVEDLKKRDSTFRRFSAHPWLSEAEKPLPPDPRQGIGKPRGSGGVRTVSGHGHKYYVRGECSSLLRSYLAYLDDWAGGDIGLHTRISYGPDVPELMSSVPISEVGAPTEGDGGSEALPSSFTGKAMFFKEVLGNHLDASLLSSWNGKRKVDGSKSQGTVMVDEDDEEGNDESSASKLAKAYGFRKKVGGHGWEWLHLVAYSMGGFQGYPQYPENLVLGTWHANSAHLIIESAAKALASATHEVIKVNVRADYYEGTLCGREIVYELSTSSGRKMTFRIDCLMRVRPTSHDEKYWFLIMADRLLSTGEAWRVMRERVQKDKKKAEEKRMVIGPKLSLAPPSPVHYSHMEEAELETPVIKDAGVERDSSYLERKRGRKSGSKDKVGPIFKPTFKREPRAVRLVEGKVQHVKVSDLSKKVSESVRREIKKAMKESGQYTHRTFEFEPGRYLQIRDYKPETETMDVVGLSSDEELGGGKT
jgi:hypothetical protein